MLNRDVHKSLGTQKICGYRVTLQINFNLMFVNIFSITYCKTILGEGNNQQTNTYVNDVVPLPNLIPSDIPASETSGEI